MKKILITGLVALYYCCFIAYAQNTGHTSLKGIMAAIDTLHGQQLVEKIYLHLDKPYYAIGDTMRFKAYLLDEALHGSLKSGLFYVELINDSNRVCKRQMIVIKNGIAWGDIVIKRKWYPGNYTLRAYTNWIRNFGQAYFFRKQVNIIPADTKSWLVNDRITIDKADNVNIDLQFTDFEHNGITTHNIKYYIMDGTHNLFTRTEKTDETGKLNIRFNLPQKLEKDQLFLSLKNISKDSSDKKILIPIPFNRPADMDLQFMPEGGNMIVGIPVKVGFKAIGENGMGTDVSGKIINSTGHEETVFQSVHNGMGSFELTPKTGETYAAQVALPDGTAKYYPLPAVNPSGVGLKIGTKGNGPLEVTLTASPDLVTNRFTCYLIGLARDKVCYGATIVFKQQSLRIKIAKDIFPTGIIKWAVFNVDNQPVAQRMVFVDHANLLDIKLTANKETYHARDSVSLKINVTDHNEKPIQGSFSLAVTDDSQVKLPGEDADNIASYMLLNSDMKGNIEGPGWYFTAENTINNKATALDNLMLTQGWAGYDWKPAFDPKAPKYEAETEIKVKGRVSNFFNKPVANTNVMLISTKPEIAMNTKTDSAGRFSFSNFPPLDTINFRIQTVRTNNIGVRVDEFAPPEFTPLKIPAMPWYLNSDTTLINYTNKRKAEQDEYFNAGKNKLLKQVNIKAPFIEFGPPFIVLDEEDIRNARTGEKPMSLLDLMDRNGKLSQIADRLIIDGQMLTHIKVHHDIIPGVKFDYANAPAPSEETAEHPDVAEWLSSFTTDDIKDFSVKKIRTVEWVFIPGLGWIPREKFSLLVNVNTKIKFGNKAMPTGDYVYRPMPVSWPHQFYSPHYKATDTLIVKDRRSTIYWKPDIITDKDGNAAVSFFSTDKPADYTVIMEGTDLNGNLGYQRKQIKVVSATTASK